MRIKQLVDYLGLNETAPFHFQKDLSYKISASCKHITCEERNDYIQKTWTIEKKYDNSTLGVYLPDITIDELYDLERKRNAINFHRVLHEINSILCLKTDEIKLAYGIYVVLHEVGHWLDFKASGKSSIEYNLWDSEFRSKFNEFRRNTDALQGDTAGELKQAKETVNMYKNIPSEKAADKYAFENIKSKMKIARNLRGAKMEQFKKITIEDRDILEKHINQCKHRACDYSSGNLILWADVYNTQFAVAKDMLFIKYLDGQDNYFTYPMGNGDLKEAFQWLFAYCEEQNIEFKMNVIEPEMFQEIEKTFPGEYEISYIRDIADYVYNMEDLKNLTGKKYHGKKNHINKFLKTNEDWSYERISEENTEECIDMVKEWCIENGCCEDKLKADEICVLINGLRHRKELDFIGGIIRTAGRIVALTMGEKSGDDMFVIHFEKAFADVHGAYPMINQQFVKHELSNYTYVNREEDLGLEGLRKAKLSYHPAFMVEKGILARKA